MNEVSPCSCVPPAWCPLLWLLWGLPGCTPGWIMCRSTTPTNRTRRARFSRRAWCAYCLCDILVLALCGKNQGKLFHTRVLRFVCGVPVGLVEPVCVTNNVQQCTIRHPVEFSVQWGGGGGLFGRADHAPRRPTLLSMWALSVLSILFAEAGSEKWRCGTRSRSPSSAWLNWKAWP